MGIILPPSIVNGLQGYWHLDSDFLDQSANKYHLTTLSGTPTDVTGRFGQAKHFTGASSQSASINGANLRVTTSQTIACWGKSTQLASQTGDLVTIYDSGSADTVAIRLLAGVPNIHVTGLTPNVKASTVTALNNTWMHFVIRYDSTGNTIAIFVNGTKDSASVTGSHAANASSSLFVGGRSGIYYDGEVDEVMFWNRALTDTEISNLYTQATNYYAYSKGRRTGTV